MRKKKWAQPELDQCPYYVDDPKAQKGKWNERFAEKRPLHLEVGCGKGVSTAKMVEDNRNINFIAMDLITDVLGDARRNVEKAFHGEKADNILLTRGDVSFIGDMFAPEDGIECVYINFCNPWNRLVKHHKRRLTHPRQLAQYMSFLKDGGEIRFKTDDDELFSDSLLYFQKCGFETVYLTRDLHGSGFAPNYQSEHEMHFAAQGIPIKFGIFKMTKRELDFDPLRWRTIPYEMREEK